MKNRITVSDGARDLTASVTLAARTGCLVYVCPTPDRYVARLRGTPVHYLLDDVNHPRGWRWMVARGVARDGLVDLNSIAYLASPGLDGGPEQDADTAWSLLPEDAYRWPSLATLLAAPRRLRNQPDVLASAVNLYAAEDSVRAATVLLTSEPALWKQVHHLIRRTSTAPVTY